MCKTMTKDEVITRIRCGETSCVQFKEKFSSGKQMAEEMAAFANSKGGLIIFGVKDKTGEIVGLTYEQIQHISSELGNVANDQVRPIVYLHTDVCEVDGKLLLLVEVAEGINKPYKDLQGQIFIKQGPDKRRVTENTEILRLFAGSQKYAPDEAPLLQTSLADLDNRLLAEYVRKVYNREVEDFGVPYERLLENMRVADAEGHLTLAGLMFFGRQPQKYCPSFMVKAVAFYGNELGDTVYEDSKDIEGTIPEMFERGMAFLKSHLYQVQDGRPFNSVGKLEVSEVALEELFQNALVHREYIKTAPIRLLVFRNRVEIVSPGCLPDGLTVDDIKLGNSFQRNPLIATFCAKTMFYRGLGSGVLRSLQDGARIDFINNETGKQFTAVINKNISTEKREDILNGDTTQKTIQNGGKTTQNTILNGEKTTQNDRMTTQNTTQNEEKTTQNNRMTTQNDDWLNNLTVLQRQILEYITEKPLASRFEMADKIEGATVDGVKYSLARLQDLNLIKRVGSKRNGHWEVIGNIE
jgi:predicted HTH transcriptional regulator